MAAQKFRKQRGTAASSLQRQLSRFAINGIVAVPAMPLLMLMATRADILGQFKTSASWSIVGWVATGLMAIAAIAFIAMSL